MEKKDWYEFKNREELLIILDSFEEKCKEIEVDMYGNRPKAEVEE